MLSRRTVILGTLLILVAASLGYAGGDEEEAIPLDQVPEVVMKAAAAAVPGIVFKSAEREIEHGVTVYELSGMADGKAYEVEVSEAGKVLEVEEGDDGEDENEDDEEDDDSR